MPSFIDLDMDLNNPCEDEQIEQGQHEKSQMLGRFIRKSASSSRRHDGSVKDRRFVNRDRSAHKILMQNYFAPFSTSIHVST